MNQNNENHDVDTGNPIQPLADLQQEVSPHFLASIRKKIYRRTAANQMVAFSWNLPKVILMEMLMLAAHFFQGSTGDNVSQRQRRGSS